MPAHLQGEGHLVLQYGHDLPIPIPDLEVDEAGVTATLSFARSPHFTVVPWSAVYVVACDDGRGVLYHEDVPPDVSVIARSEDEISDHGAGGRAGTSPRLSGVSSAGPGPADADAPMAPVDIAPRPAPARVLRAVPLGGQLEESHVDLIDDSRAPSLPARRRKRPQLRLVK